MPRCQEAPVCPLGRGVVRIEDRGRIRAHGGAGGGMKPSNLANLQPNHNCTRVILKAPPGYIKKFGRARPGGWSGRFIPGAKFSTVMLRSGF